MSARAIRFAALAAFALAVAACGDDAPADLSAAATGATADTTVVATPTDDAVSSSVTESASGGGVDGSFFTPYQPAADEGAVYATPECDAAWTAWTDLISGPTALSDLDQVRFDASARSERLEQALADLPDVLPQTLAAAADLVASEGDLAVAYAEFENRADDDDTTTYAAMQLLWDDVVQQRITVRTQLGVMCAAVGSASGN